MNRIKLLPMNKYDDIDNDLDALMGDDDDDASTDAAQTASRGDGSLGGTSDPNHHPLLKDLTDAQRLAVTTTMGPVLVHAAAGSGKTRVITRRVAFLVRDCGVAPWEILAITFTNKAAGEMRERIQSLLSERQARALNVGTFHSICVRLLREYADRLDLPSNFSIYDSTDQNRAIKTAMESLEVSSEHFAPRQVLAVISNAKNDLVGADQFAEAATDHYSRTVARIYLKYREILNSNAALDFDDLLVRTARLVRIDDEARDELQERFKFIMVDEYQDTNHAQFAIAHTLSQKYRNICAVGDPDQSIYGWRGANIRNILDFEKYFPDAKILELGQNYRSTPQILSVADTLIKRNCQRRDKKLWTANADGSNVRVITATDEANEAETIVDWFKSKHKEGYKWQDMAVFYRANHLSRVMEDELLHASIPYVVARGTAFYERKEVKDALAYLRFVSNPADDVNLERIINVPPRGIGGTTFKKIFAHSMATGKGLWDLLCDIESVPGLTKRAFKAINRFVDTVKSWHRKIFDEADIVMEMRDIVTMIVEESELESHYAADKKEGENKVENLHELINAAHQFDENYEEEDATTAGRLSDYLASVSLVADLDAVDSSAGAVTLMTLHAAKGLEFAVVAIIGLEEGLLPHSRSMESEDDMEEERRLLFVGITRAREHLAILNANRRTIHGYSKKTIQSQFLNELPQDLIESESVSSHGDYTYEYDNEDDHRKRQSRGQRKPAYARSGSSTANQPKVTAQSATGDMLESGCKVSHPVFGVGHVVALTPLSRPDKAKVYFEGGGTRVMVLRFAPLKRVD